VKLSSYYLIFQNTLHKMILKQPLLGSLLTRPLYTLLSRFSVTGY